MPSKAAYDGASLSLDAMAGRSPVATRYLALLTAAPSDATTVATMAELTTAGYARQLVTFAAPAGTPRRVAAAADLLFGALGGTTPQVTHLALVSTPSGSAGSFIYYWQADAPLVAVLNDTIQVAAAQLTMTVR